MDMVDAHIVDLAETDAERRRNSFCISMRFLDCATDCLVSNAYGILQVSHDSNLALDSGARQRDHDVGQPRMIRDDEFKCALRFKSSLNTIIILPHIVRSHPIRNRTRRFRINLNFRQVRKDGILSFGRCCDNGFGSIRDLPNSETNDKFISRNAEI